MSDSIVLEVIKSDGLAHRSYLIGDGNMGAVIDPRRDTDIYLQLAQQHQLQIRFIFETHRNEDYVSGAVELARRTRAPIFHGKKLRFSFGNPVNDNDEFEIGKLKLRILETPAHTPESISIAFYDTEAGESALGVFTGDLLFIGSTGRTDLIKGKEQELAEKQYQSIFKKVLPLGDQVVLYPAHGAGSVCGAGMASRDISTLGYERMHNKALQAKDQQTFVTAKLQEKPIHPPYFSKMEEYNQQGNAPALDRLPAPEWWTVEQMKRAAESGVILLDVRSAESIAGAFVPKSLTIPLSLLPAYAGFFLQYGKDIALIAESADQYTHAVTHLRRLGFDSVRAFLADGIKSWETSGERFAHIDTVTAQDVMQHLQNQSEGIILDVRKQEEIEKSGKLPGALHVFLGDMPGNISTIPMHKPIITFCGSGQRAIIAATLLKNCGAHSVSVHLGSMSACQSAGCPIEHPVMTH